jgi:type IV fimbrial biogenesis protein FimT
LTLFCKYSARLLETAVYRLQLDLQIRLLRIASSRARQFQQQHASAEWEVKAEAGFTLVELIIVLAVAAIILSLVAPSFRDFMLTTRATSATNQLANDLNFARSEALKRNLRVLVCATDASGNCAASSNWALGWKLCYDADSDAACDASSTANPNPIRVKAAIAQGLTLTGPAQSFWFTGTGAQVSAAGGRLNFTIDGARQSQTAAVETNGNVVKNSQ